MSQVKQHFRRGLNRLLRPMGAELVPLSWQQQLRGTVTGELTFAYLGQQLSFFLHHYNCGGHPLLATERTVELSIADQWLTAVGARSVLEIGAVTPYYWPYRVCRIVDPHDPHPLVTDRSSVEDIDLGGATVLSISTFEHFGSGDYGLPLDGSLIERSLRRLCEQAARFLVTMPLGYNPLADSCVLTAHLPSNVALTFMARQPGPPFWSVVESPPRGGWKYCGGRANAVAILQYPTY
jgi:hypothetical protein